MILKYSPVTSTFVIWIAAVTRQKHHQTTFTTQRKSNQGGGGLEKSRILKVGKVGQRGAWECLRVRSFTKTICRAPTVCQPSQRIPSIQQKWNRCGLWPRRVYSSSTWQDFLKPRLKGAFQSDRIYPTQMSKKSLDQILAFLLWAT